MINKGKQKNLYSGIAYMVSCAIALGIYAVQSIRFGGSIEHVWILSVLCIIPILIWRRKTRINKTIDSRRSLVIFSIGLFLMEGAIIGGAHAVLRLTLKQAIVDALPLLLLLASFQVYAFLKLLRLSQARSSDGETDVS